MRKLLVLLAALGMSFIACEKEEDTKTTIVGSLIDFYSGNKVPNVKLKVFESDGMVYFYPQSTYFSVNYGYNKVIDSVVTDSSGDFKMSIESLNSSRRYNISLFDNVSISDSLYMIIPDSYNDMQIRVKKFKLLQINLKNSSNKNFALSIISDNKFGVWYLFNNTFTDTLLSVKVIPDTKCKVLWDYYLEYPNVSDSIIFDVNCTDTARVYLTI